MRLEPTRSPGRGDRDLRHISAQKMKMLPSEDSNPLPGLLRHFGAAQGDQAAMPPQDAAGGDQPVHPLPCQNSFIGADLAFRALVCSAVFADQAAGDLSALDPGGDIDGVAGLALRSLLLRALCGRWPL
jgi:hypothetical protein